MTTRRRVPGWLMLVGAMTAVGPVSIDMYLPGFPAIERDLGSRGVEVTMAAYMIGIAVGQLFYGPISDRFGRKPPLYLSFALYSLGSMGCALASSMPMLIAMRVVQALGGCGGMVIGRAIVRDRCEPHEAARAFSTLMLISALGPVLAPAAGGVVVAMFGWRATFVFQALMGLGLLISVHKLMSESLDPRAAAPLDIGAVMRTYARLVLDRPFLGYSLLSGFAFAAMFSYVTGAPTVLTQNYGLSTQQFGALIGLNGFAFMTASQLNILALRTESPTAIVGRYALLPAVLGCLLLTASLLLDIPLWLVVALQLSLFVSVGRVTPNVTALALTAHGRHAGTAAALMGAVQSALSMLAGLAVATFNDGSVRTLATIMTGASVLALLSYLWARGGERAGPIA